MLKQESIFPCCKFGRIPLLEILSLAFVLRRILVLPDTRIYGQSTSTLPPLLVHPSVSLSLSQSLSFFHLIHPQPPSSRSSYFGHAHTYISPTDCLSSIFCSTLRHDANRWITFLAPKLCTNISWLTERARMKNVNTRALQATDQFSWSVGLGGIHQLLQRLNVAAQSLSLFLQPSEDHYPIYTIHLTIVSVWNKWIQ